MADRNSENQFNRFFGVFREMPEFSIKFKTKFRTFSLKFNLIYRFESILDRFWNSFLDLTFKLISRKFICFIVNRIFHFSVFLSIYN